MTEIKTKKKYETTIKKFDRVMIIGKNLKSNIVNVKDKTKENYEKNENTAQEYAENKVNNTIRDVAYNTLSLNRKGKQNFEKTKGNIDKINRRIKKVHNEIKNIRENKKIAMNKTKEKNMVKSGQKVLKQTEETARIVARKEKQVAKNSIREEQRVIQKVKQITKSTAKSIKLIIKKTIEMLKVIGTTTKALITALIAGGWVAVVIIILVCLIAMLCSSTFGIFFSNEKNAGDKMMSSVIREINIDFTNRIIEIQKSIQHDEYEINSNRAKWKDILSIFAVVVSNGEEQTDVIIMDNNKINKLKKIFWEMNTISSSVKEIEKNIEIIDESGNKKIEKKKIKMLYIDVTSKSLQEMIELYKLNQKQKEQLEELQKDEYNSMWSCVCYGSSSSKDDIVQVALSQVGNAGGRPYWSWYGYTNRVEWCACFVSWCAEQCGYIENGIIPKFSNCHNEGIAWFKACNLWHDKTYTPQIRRYNIFRLGKRWAFGSCWYCRKSRKRNSIYSRR